MSVVSADVALLTTTGGRCRLATVCHLLPRMLRGIAACAQYAPVGQTWRDPESLEDVPLVPGMTPMENQLRWGFVQKVSPSHSSELAGGTV